MKRVYLGPDVIQPPWSEYHLFELFFFYCHCIINYYIIMAMFVWIIKNLDKL